jgi:hypothetical protein
MFFRFIPRWFCPFVIPAIALGMVMMLVGYFVGIFQMLDAVAAMGRAAGRQTFLEQQR